MNAQQHYRNNTNEWIQNEQEQSSYTPSFLVHNIESSSNNQYTGMPRAEGKVAKVAMPRVGGKIERVEIPRAGERGGMPPSLLSTSSNFFQFK